MVNVCEISLNNANSSPDELHHFPSSLATWKKHLPLTVLPIECAVQFLDVANPIGEKLLLKVVWFTFGAGQFPRKQTLIWCKWCWAKGEVKIWCLWTRALSRSQGELHCWSWLEAMSQFEAKGQSFVSSHWPPWDAGSRQRGTKFWTRLLA